MAKRKWIIPVAVFLILILLLAGWRALRVRRAGSTRYATATVERGLLEVTVTNNGTLLSGAQRDIRPTITATVDEVLVNVGASVKKGQVIARLSNADLISARTQAEASLAAEESRLADLEHPESRATASDLRNARFRVSQAESAVAQRQADVAGLTLAAPVSGRVATLTAQVGDSLTAGVTVATVSDLNDLTVTASVSQFTVNLLRKGDPATVTCNGVKRSGTITGISPVGSGASPTFPVTISLQPISYDDGIRPGMSASIHFDNTGNEATGAISGRTWSLRSRTAATVASVAVNIGDAVAANQTLVTLSSDTATSALAQAENELENARVALDNLLNPSVTATTTELAAERAKVEQLRASYATACSNVDQLTVTAPLSGVVTARNVNPGDRITPTSTQAPFSVADLDAMTVQISVDELDVARLRVDMPATVTVQAAPGRTFEATVASISPQGTVSQGVATYPVKLIISDPQNLLVGMTANVSIVCERRENVLLVPVEAVQQVRDKAYVKTMGSDGRPVEVEVKTGIANDIYTEITSGLTEGQTIVTGTIANTGMFGGMSRNGRDGTSGDSTAAPGSPR